ncbi:MAG TPA: phage portal protein [Candidatus Dojkabacteria bacterium]|nr:phage portal protein [Candidatus Dojkabacteria bacterium]
MAISFNPLKRFFTGVYATQSVEAPRHIFNKALISLFNGDRNGDVALNEAEKIAAVYTCIKTLSETVSKLPVVIKNFDGIVQDDLYRVLNYKPNNYLNRQTFYSTIITHLYLDGNCYVQINRDNAGRVANLQILPIKYFDEIKVVKNKLWYYNKQEDRVFRGEDILHFKLISKDSFFGMNPIESLRTEININFKAQATVDRFYSKNANSTKVLEYVGAAGNNKKLEEVIEKFEAQTGGYDNAGSVITIPPNFKLNELKLSVEDAKFLSSAEFTEKSIAALFGVPVTMLGHNQNNYSTYEQQLIAFNNNTISALLSIITTELEFKLLSDAQIYMGYQIEFDVEKLAGTTAIDRVNYFKTLKDMGVLSPNQIAAKLGYEQSDSEYMNYHYQQSQYIPLEKWNEGIAAMKGIENKKDSKE